MLFKNDCTQIENSKRLRTSQYKLSLNVTMLRCYPHVAIKGILLKIFKIRRSSNSKEERKEAQSFFIDLFKAHFSYS